MSIERLTAQLRGLRARVDAQRDNTHTSATKEVELAADLLGYDRRLLRAATMLGVSSSGGARRGCVQLSEDEHRPDSRGLGARRSAHEGSAP